jgi:hypothetical protein
MKIVTTNYANFGNKKAGRKIPPALKIISALA